MQIQKRWARDVPIRSYITIILNPTEADYLSIALNAIDIPLHPDIGDMITDLDFALEDFVSHTKE